jgi:radial spoke head protein 9
VDAGKKVISNAYFEGLSFQTSSEPRAYLHLRQPESLQGLALLKRPGIIKSGDFLDCINKDVPKEMWTIQHNSAGTMSFVRNIYWEGYSFYTVLNTNEYGGAYFGMGIPNYDIAFML